MPDIDNVVDFHNKKHFYPLLFIQLICCLILIFGNYLLMYYYLFSKWFNFAYPLTYPDATLTKNKEEVMASQEPIVYNEKTDGNLFGVYILFFF